MVRRRVMVVIALSVMIFTATTSVLVGLGDAPAAFAAGEGYVITSSGAPTIFSSRVSMDMASALEQMENITGVSPEVFAFSCWNGHSFVVRGVDQNSLGSVGPELRTEWSADLADSSMGYALLGERLADRLDMSIPSTILLAGSYSAKVELVVVAGTFSSGSALDDEMLVPTDVARRLTGMGSDDASIIRVATSEPAWLESLLAPEAARFTIYDLSVSKSRIGPDEVCSVTVSVRNWGRSSGSATMVFSDGPLVFAEEQVTLNASSSSSVSVPYSSSVKGTHNITVGISGDFPVTLGSSVEVVDPYLVASFPRTVMLGSSLDVAVVTYAGDPALGVIVTLSDSLPSSNTTDSAGQCSLSADEAGEFPLIFDADDTEFDGMPVHGSEAEVEVVDPSSFPPEFLPSVTSFELSPSSIKEGETATVIMTVENRGSVGGVAEVDVLVDSSVHSTLQVTLGPAEGAVVSVTLEDVAPGSHTVQVGDFSASLDVAPWYADNPDLVELVVRYGGSSTLSSAGSLPIYQAAKISEGNVALALFALGTIAALLATLAIVSVFSKEVHEGRKRLGILKAIGASRRHIRMLVFPQALVAALAGSVVGVASGLLIAVALVRSDAFMVFGHVLEFGVSAGIVLLTLVGAVAISLVSALASAEIAARETTISSIKDLPGDEGPQPDVSELLGEG